MVSYKPPITISGSLTEAEEEGEEWEVFSLWGEESYSRSPTSDCEDSQSQLSTEEEELVEEFVD